MEMKLRAGRGIANGDVILKRKEAKCGGKKRQRRYARAKLEEKFASAEIDGRVLLTAFTQRGAPRWFALAK
jgi:hypothetical protein